MQGTLSLSELDLLSRVHVNDPAMWGVQAGTDFWLFSSGLQLTAGRTLITDGGWTATSLSLTAGTGADLMTAADVGTPGHFTTNAGADLLQSPAIFGDYLHAKMAAQISQNQTLPRYLCMEAYGAFDTFSANETTTNVGFVENGGSPVVAADRLAMFSVGAANYVLASGAASQIGVTVADAAYHWFAVVLDRVTQLAYGYVDRVAQGSIALETDLFPCSFGMGDGTTNRFQLSQAHVWYAWAQPVLNAA